MSIGCDSGFGHNLAKRLDSRGFYVFATCLFPEGKGAEELRNQCSEKLKILGMDVTKDESVSTAFQYVKDNLRDSVLWAIVNNAGIQKGFSVDFASLQDFKDTMEVNGFGMVRVTKAFLPLLKQSRGRIVNITSFQARLSAPYATPYVMSKFAAAGFSDALRMELNDWGIRVIQVEPELFHTMINDVHEMSKRFDLQTSSIGTTLVQEYGEEYFENLKMASLNFLEKYYSPNIERVIDDLEEAVSSKYPSITYRSSRSDFIAILTIIAQLMPYAVSDMLTKATLYFSSFPKPKAA